jgi:myo-inositol 2-dehydrogenase/D-chiro-inositol 1-dehydrogenase
VAVRIGFVGTGGISRSHLVNLVQMPEVEVVGLCDIAPEQIEATRKAVEDRVAQQGVTARPLDAIPYTDYRAMLRNERLDGLFICVPPFAHGEIDEAAIEAGIPMMIEKPVALELTVASRILEGIQRKGLITGAGYVMRYNDAVGKAKEILAGKTIGMVVVMRFGGTPGTPWYPIQSKSGGQLIEMATHQVDMLRYVIGEIKTVYAAGATRINNKENPNYDVFDVNCMTLTFDNGAVANFANNMISGHGSPSEARGTHFFAENMTVSVGRSLQVITPEGIREVPTERTNAMFLEDQAFVRAIAEQNPALLKSDYLDAVRTLAVTVAGDRSARIGKPVNVAELLAAEAPNAAFA